jgi:sugar/nucleoside kinase (ribokinase family)
VSCVPLGSVAVSRVIHTGQALVDFVLEVEALPPRGDNVMARTAREYAGGSVSVLVAVARTGAPAVHAGALGVGPNGDLIRATLQEEGIELSSPVIPDQDSGTCVVLVEPSAERTFVTTLGAERRITVDSLATAAPVAGDLVCVTGYSLLEPTRDPLLAWLESLDEEVRVVLDPGAAFAALREDVKRRMLARTWLWTSNAAEAVDVTGVPEVPDTPAALEPLLPVGALIVVRDGPVGCYVRWRDSTTYVPGFPQEPVDTNGAGDAHTGVLVAELALGGEPLTAARRANAAGAIKVTRKGPSTAPGRGEVDRFLTDLGT